MKLYAKDLVDFLNRDWGLGTLSSINLDYLSRFSSLAEGRFAEPLEPDALVDLDELDATAVNVVTSSPDGKAHAFSCVTLARLCAVSGVKDAAECEPPSLRAHPKLEGI